MKNNFSYRLRAAPPEIKELWAKLKKSKTLDAARKKADFMKEVGKVGGEMTYEGVANIFTTTESAVEIDGQAETKGWVPWKTFTDLYGKEQVDAMMLAGTVSFRPCSALMGTSIEYPRNQEFWNEKLEYKSDHATEKRTEVKKSGETDQATADEIRACMNIAHTAGRADMPGKSSRSGCATPVVSSGSVTPGTPRSETDNDLGTPGGSTRDVKPVLAQLRKAHGEWDRKKMDFCGVLAKSGGSDMTRGTHMEGLLQKAIQQGSAIDADLMAMQISIQSGTSTAKQEEDCAMSIANLVAKGQAASRYASAIKQLLKVTPHENE